MGNCCSRADSPVTKQRMESKMAALKAGHSWAAPNQAPYAAKCSTSTTDADRVMWQPQQTHEQAI